MILRQRSTSPRREHPWVRTRVVLPRPGVPTRGRYGPKVPRTGVLRRGHFRPIFLTRPPTGWHRRLLILLLTAPQPEWCCSGNRRPTFRSALLRRIVVEDVSYSCAEQYMMAESDRIFEDHCAVELIFSSPDPSTDKRVGRGVRSFDSAVWDREKQSAVLSGTYAKFTQNPAMSVTLGALATNVWPRPAPWT